MQHKTVDDLTAELGLPINQTLAMFNKAVKKMSVTFHNLLVEEERKGLLSGEAMKKAEMKVHKIRDIVSQTLEEDVAEAATVAMESLTQQHGGSSSSSGVTGTRMAPEIMDPEIMKYALKGTDEDWANAIKEKDFISGDGSSGTIQVKSSKKTSNKRKAGDQDVLESVLKNEKNMMSSSTPGKKRDKKKTKKQSRKTM